MTWCVARHVAGGSFSAHQALHHHAFDRTFRRSVGMGLIGSVYILKFNIQNDVDVHDVCTIFPEQFLCSVVVQLKPNTHTYVNSYTCYEKSGELQQQ